MPKDKNTDLRQPAEVLFAEELDALIKAESNWFTSTFLSMIR